MSKITYQHFRPKKDAWKHLGIVRGSTPWEHVRRYYRGANAEWEADPKGGITVCYLTTAQGEQFSGEGNCSVQDPFCFAEGRKWAFKHAVETMLESKGVANTNCVILEEGIVAWAMPLVDAITAGKYIRSFLNSSYFSDTARNELYKALQNAYIHGDYS